MGFSYLHGRVYSIYHRACTTRWDRDSCDGGSEHAIIDVSCMCTTRWGGDSCDGGSEHAIIDVSGVGTTGWDGDSCEYSDEYSGEYWANDTGENKLRFTGEK